MSTQRLNSTMIIGLGLTGLGLAAVVASFGINLDHDGGWGARTFPLVGSATLVVLGVIEMLKGRAMQPVPTNTQETSEANPLARIITLLILSFAYLWLIGKIGYLISTGLAAVAALMVFGIRNPLGLTLAAILCPLVYHLIFFVLLGVFPPYGEWFEPLDIIQGY